MGAIVSQRQVEWGDCDALGIVFYPNYFRWMDAAFHAWSPGIGFSQRSLDADYGLAGTPLIDVGCRFQSPATYGDVLTVELRVTRVGASSMRLDYQFLVGERQAAEGFEVRVFVQPDATGRLGKAPIPDPIRQALEAAQQ